VLSCYAGSIVNTRMLNINKNSLSENKDIFNQWLVGFTDGDGTFSITRQNKYLVFNFSNWTKHL